VESGVVRVSAPVRQGRDRGLRSLTESIVECTVLMSDEDYGPVTLLVWWPAS